MKGDLARHKDAKFTTSNRTIGKVLKSKFFYISQSNNRRYIQYQDVED